MDRNLEAELDRLVSDSGMSRAAVVREALKRFAREAALERLRQSERDIKAGHVYTGDLRDLLKKIG